MGWSKVTRISLDWGSTAPAPSSGTVATTCGAAAAAEVVKFRMADDLGAGDCPRYKPDPSGLLLALQRLGCSPEMAVYVGDHLVDAQAAAAARVAFIAVLTGLFGAHEFRKFPVQAIIPDVRELPAVLGLGEGGNGANRQGRSQQPDDGRRMVDFDPSQADSRV